jgi:hypothetical protein
MVQSLYIYGHEDIFGNIGCWWAVAGEGVAGGGVGSGGGGGGGGQWAAALPVVSDGGAGEAAADVLFGVLRASVEAKVGPGVSKGPGVFAR